MKNYLLALLCFCCSGLSAYAASAVTNLGLSFFFMAAALAFGAVAIVQFVLNINWRY